MQRQVKTHGRKRYTEMMRKKFRECKREEEEWRGAVKRIDSRREKDNKKRKKNGDGGEEN